MKLNTKSIHSSVNKAYFIQDIVLKNFVRFRKAYNNLLNSIVQNETEETLKDYVNDFLKDAFYKERFTIKENINNIDLVVYNDNIENNIAIIIETKSLKNTAEMITQNELNKKALWEVILYYLEERITSKNLEIKHIIITNTIDWYIFNASEFEKVFYKNKELFNNFNKWKTEKFVSKTKEFFYKQIAKPFVEKSEEEITCNYFKLVKIDKLSESSLIEFYKVFSPEHLLKLSFFNDSNSLNLEFYDEILHIIGLYETNNKARTIERKKPKERNENSFLESVISIIENDEILRNLKDPEQHGDNKEEQIFSIALELSLTWVNRIIFLKLLESQLVKYNNNNRDYLFLNTNKIKDFDELRELFFDILAIKINERREKLKEKYKHIPYLNSSLFEQTVLEREAVKINHLKHSAKIPVSEKSVLKDKNGKKLKGTLPLLEYIFRFLDSYNFASNNKTQIQETPKTLINSSVLGLIFEKLNGYKEGSFFTPGYVTMYICRETIRNAVVQKFNTEHNWQCKSIDELYNKISRIELKTANKTFNTVRICDPAVGSGHFLVSVLNEFIAIKSELGIIIDKKGKLLRNVYCEVQNDEIYINYFDNMFEYNFHDRENQRIQETIFYEKRTLIENCLFGVDINPKSVQICRLRLWIELLKNSFYTSESNFKELETLPNIDINIKCGNSLVSHFLLNGNGNKKMPPQKMQLATKKYKKAVREYKNANIRYQKRQAEKAIKELKEEISRYANPIDKDYIEIGKIIAEIDSQKIFFSKEEHTQWKMKVRRLSKELVNAQERYEKKKRSVFAKTLEWRFEFPEVLDNKGNFTGFDAIVGNPPYISAVNMARNKWLKAYFKNAYPEATGAYDIYVLFLKKATELLKQNGFYGWIIPNKFLATQYAKKTRELLINTGLSSSVDISNINVFKKASVYPIMIFGKNKSKKTKFRKYRTELKTEEQLSDELYEYPEMKKYKSFNEMGIKIKSGTTGFEAQKIKLLILKRKVKGSIPFVVSGCIDRYSLDFKNVRYMKSLYKKAFIHNNKKTIAKSKWDFWNNKKIVIAGMTKEIEAIWTEQPLAIGVGTYGIYEFGNYNPKFLLGILNSSFMSYYVVNKFRDKHLAGGYIAINKNMISEFPIVDINKHDQKPIIELVNKLLKIKNRNKKNIRNIENQIDKLVYKLYNISDKEIKIIENETT